MKCPRLFLLALTLILCTSGLLPAQHGKITRELELESFTSLGLGIEGTVYLIPGPTQRVMVEGQADLIDQLDLEVKGGSWDISFDGRVRDYDRLVFRITLPTIDNLAIGGSGEITTEAPFEDLDDLQFAIGGSGTITFAGSAESLEVSIGGSGTVRAEALQVDQCQVSIGGSGNAFVSVEENLNVSIAGSGDVEYSGSPRVSSSIVGGGQVRGN